MHEPHLPRYPVDEATYDLLVVLSSKLEAMHAYERFADDPGSHRSLYRRLLEEETRHAELLVDALRERLLATPTPDRRRERLGYDAQAGTPSATGQGPADPSLPHGRAGLTDPRDLRFEATGSSELER